MFSSSWVINLNIIHNQHLLFTKAKTSQTSLLTTTYTTTVKNKPNDSAGCVEIVWFVWTKVETLSVKQVNIWYVACIKEYVMLETKTISCSCVLLTQTKYLTLYGSIRYTVKKSCHSPPIRKHTTGAPHHLSFTILLFPLSSTILAEQNAVSNMYWIHLALRKKYLLENRD